MMLSSGPLLALSSLFLVSAAVPALAQASVGRFSVFAAGAAHTLWADESFNGTGVAAGGGVGVNVTDRLDIRGRVMRSYNRRDFGRGAVFESTAARFTADLIWQLSSGSHAAYVGAGAGAFRIRRESRFPIDQRQPSGPVQVVTSSATERIFGAIGGFTAFSKGGFSLQPEASIWLTPRAWDVVIETGVLARWRIRQ